MDILASDVLGTLSGILQLRGAAFVDGIALPEASWVAFAVVLVAGLSEAVGQSVILFANRVKKSRFLLSLGISALLFVASYAFLVGSTWLIMLLSRHAPVSFFTLALVMAFTTAPLAFSFLGALPYLGVPIVWILRAWHLLAIVVGIAAVVRVSYAEALLYAGLGWLFKAVAEQTFGSFIAKVGSGILDTAAGVQVRSEEQLRLEPLEREGSHPLGHPETAVAIAASGVKTPAHSLWSVAAGLAFICFLAYFVDVALRPFRHAVFGWQAHLPPLLQLPIDLLWIGIIALVVGAFMAPLETLEWWAGWYGEGIKTAQAPAAGPAGAAPPVSRFIAYLDGISQSSARYTPDIETFLDALAPVLPKDFRLVRGIMSYSVINRPLDDDPILAWFWRFIDKLRFANQASLLGMIVNLRNVLIVAVSADPRYGPLYNHGIAQIIHDALIAAGYRPKSGTPITLIGYSGGGQMSAASAPILRAAFHAPVEVISLGGVIDGSCRFSEIDIVYHLVGTKDRIEPLGPILFPSRWSIAFNSNWNRAVRAGRLHQLSLGPVGHQVPGGMLDPNARLPDGRTNLQQTLDTITQILAEKLQSKKAHVLP